MHSREKDLHCCLEQNDLTPMIPRQALDSTSIEPIKFYTFHYQISSMNDQTFIILFRLLHIGFGIVWAGSILYITFFVMPAVKKSGQEGTKFWLQLSKTGYPIFIMLSALISILSGILLLWKLSNHFERVWFTTLYAKILCAGIVTSIIAFLIGIIINQPAAIRIGRINAAITKSGSITSEQMRELITLQKKIFSATIIIAVLLVITIISMSIIRWVS